MSGNGRSNGVDRFGKTFGPIFSWSLSVDRIAKMNGDPSVGEKIIAAKYGTIKCRNIEERVRTGVFSFSPRSSCRPGSYVVADIYILDGWNGMRIVAQGPTGIIIDGRVWKASPLPKRV
jgi:hypothetical protein